MHPALAEMEIPPEKRLLGEFLCEANNGILYAPRGLGKTWMVNLVADGIATGRAIGEWEAGENPAKVLIFDGEMALRQTQERAKLLRIGSQNISFLHHQQIYDKFERSLNIADPEQHESPF